MKKQIKKERDSRGVREYINSMQYCMIVWKEGGGGVHYITHNIKITQMLLP